MSRTFYMKLAVGSGAIAVLVLCAYLAAGALQERQRLRVVPAGLGVTRVLYGKEESWGLGPGGHETGVIVYSLPDEMAAKIQTEGIRCLAELSGKSAGKPEWWQHGSWLATPVQLEGRDSKSDEVIKSHEIENHLYRWGFGIDIDPTVRRQINDSISKGGSFLLQTGSRTLLVAPSLQRVFYIYTK
jgi:hypothetical protein